MSAYTVGGTVTGLLGSGLVLQNNGGDDLTIVADGSFAFSSSLASGVSYNVLVATQPSGQFCAITDGSGTIAAANVTDISVSCGDSGSFDTTFDNDGYFVHHGAAGGNGIDRGEAIATQSDGKILVTGYSHNGSNYRYDA